MLVSVKSPGLLPVILALIALSVALPVFVSVTVCTADVIPTGALKLRTLAEIPTAGAGKGVPFPLSVTCCGDVGVALSVTDRTAAAPPRDVGANITLIVHEPPTATTVALSQAVEPYGPGVENSSAFTPPIEITLS